MNFQVKVIDPKYMQWMPKDFLDWDSGKQVKFLIDLLIEYQKEIVCPFCGEGDFDKVGLKHHLQDHCEVYRDTAALEEKG